MRTGPDRSRKPRQEVSAVIQLLARPHESENDLGAPVHSQPGYRFRSKDGNVIKDSYQKSRF